MADVADSAQDGIELDAQLGIAAALVAIQGEGSDDCENCGEEIPADRRQAAPWAVRCAPCQSIVELARKGVRRG